MRPDDDDDDENKLVIKDGKVKPKSTEERAKIPKLKCSLLQDYARSRVSVEEELEKEEEEDLLVPEQRLNLLMASPSITRRRASMMPATTTSSRVTNWQQHLPTSTMKAKREDRGDKVEEEIPLLAIPKLLLRRASTQLGFKGLGNLKEQEQEQEMILRVETAELEEHEENLGDQLITEETDQEIADEAAEVKCNEYNNECEDTLDMVKVENVPDKEEVINISISSSAVEVSGEIIPDEGSVNEGKVRGESSESVLYVIAESIPVPPYPNARQPPLDYFPFALTASNNNVLYVVTETLPVPRLRPRATQERKSRSETSEDKEEIEEIIHYSENTGESGEDVGR